MINRNNRWLLPSILSLVFCNMAYAQIEQLSYSFEQNPNEGRSNRLYSFNRGYFPLTDSGRFLSNGRSGMALDRDVMVVGSLDPIESTQVLTLSLWFKNAGSGQTQTLISRLNPRDQYGMSLELLDSGQALFRLRDKAGGEFSVRTDASVVVNTEWHHLVFSFQAELAEYQFYLDGDAIGMEVLSDSLASDVGTSHPLIIGAGPELQPFTGALDEVQIIPRFFSEEAVQCLQRLDKDCVYRPTQATRGPRGEQGDPGPQGPRGPQGPLGAEGEPGDVGLAGVAGSQGEQGPQGPQGIRGPKGLAGVNGSDGQDGVDGQNGQDGAVGDPGAIGDPGPRGAQGDRGPQGDKGVRGDRGPTGAKGDKGLTGLTGDKGARGDKGVRGDAGPKGQTGPKGTRGAKGDRGLVGDRGPVGPQGATGPAGFIGPKGIVGPKGPRGPQGAQGPRGYRGCDRANPNWIPACNNMSGSVGEVDVKTADKQQLQNVSKMLLSNPAIDLSDYGVRDEKLFKQLMQAMSIGRSEATLRAWTQNNLKSQRLPKAELTMILRAMDRLMLQHQAQELARKAGE